MIRGAPDRFDHIVLELASDAADALASGGDVRIRLPAHAGRISLLVSDTGCGISAERLRALLTETPAEVAHGTGL